jgi:glycerophosphoryl diester phosphodiesterase
VGHSGISACALIGQPRVLVIAHRGDSRVAPENTLPAFISAVQSGADLVEFDYHHSADGVPLVLHDAVLDRTTDASERWCAASIEIRAKSAADLQTLDAGGWFDPRFAGTRIPTLGEALDVIHPDAMPLVEHKAGDAATCVRILAERGLLDRAVVQSFDWQFLADCRRLAPALVLGALGKYDLCAQRLDQIGQTGAAVVGWSDRDLTPQGIAAIHARGLRAWVFTVDDPRRAAVLVAAGIDAIITNVPATMRACLASTPVAPRTGTMPCDGADVSIQFRSAR